MTKKEIEDLRKSFIESELFDYYEKHGNRAESYTDTYFLMKGGRAKMMGLKGGSIRGKQWKKMIENSDPRIKAHYQKMNIESQKYFKQNPKARDLRSKQQTIAFNRFIKDLKKSGEYREWKKIAIDKFKRWASENPEITKKNAKIAGKESLRKRKEDLVSHKKQCSAAGKKGMASLQKMYKENPELKAKNHKIACAAASKKNHEDQILRTKQCIEILKKVLPKTFFREDLNVIKKEYKLTWRSIDAVIKNPEMVSSEMFRPEGLKGKGGSKLRYTRIF